MSTTTLQGLQDKKRIPTLIFCISRTQKSAKVESSRDPAVSWAQVGVRTKELSSNFFMRTDPKGKREKARSGHVELKIIENS